MIVAIHDSLVRANFALIRFNPYAIFALQTFPRLLFTVYTIAAIHPLMKKKNRKTKEFKRKTTILINRVLISTCSESFEFIAFCIGFIGIAFLVVKFVFVRYAIEYFDSMLIICPAAYYFTYRHKTGKKIKNE